MRTPSIFRIVSTAAFLSFCVAPVVAQAETAKAILLDAVKNGQATEEMTGDQADVWKAKTKSHEPVMVVAKVTEKLSQPGCVRLHVKMTQAGVPKQTGGAGPLEVGWDMNICEDGSLPAAAEMAKEAAGPVKIKKVEAQ